MHVQTKYHHYVSITARAIMVLMLILPACSPAGLAQARGLPASSAPGVAVEHASVILDVSPQTLPFSQNWSITSLITVNDDWTGVPGIVGYRGDGLTAANDIDPQTVLGESTLVIDVNANQTDPNAFITGGVTEFELSDPVVALQGSATADAPYVQLYINTTGMQDVPISYNLRDIDGSIDNSVQQVALHYRVGSTGNFTNIPAGYVADATTGPSLATLVTPVNVTLPAEANDQPLVQIRIMTTNATGSDEWVGIDDISIGSLVPKMQIGKTAPASVNVNENFDYTLSAVNSLGEPATQVVITDSLPVSVTFVSASDSGVLIDTNVVSWTIPTMADGTTAIRTVTVTAPSMQTTLVNEVYGVWASNWIIGTLGAPVSTIVNAPLPITPIAEARAAGAGWYGTVQGNVYVLPGTFAARSFAIQDATGGLYIYPASTVVRPPMVLGDVVQVKGTIKNYNGLLEMDPVESIVWIDSGTVPDPLVTPTGNLAPTQGKLVQIEGTALSMSGTGNKTILFNDGSGQTSVYIYTLSGIDTSMFTFPTPMRVTGMSGAFNTPQVNPRFQSDIVILPEVTSTYPEADASGVNLYRALTATFNHAMDPTTFNTSSFTLTNSLGPISGVVDYDVDTETANLTPSSILLPSTLYTATLTTDIKDSSGIALPSEYTWSFTSGIVDAVQPSIVTHDPASGEIDVPLDANVVITFSEGIDPATLGMADFLVEGSFGDVPYALTYNASTFAATLNPDQSLLPTSEYTVTVLSAIEDWAGNPLVAGAEWTFSTMAEPPMNAYFGDLHNHTSISDGSGTPAEALAAGEAAGFDFMAISDHSYSIDDTDWANTLNAVEGATNANFVALRGFEYTQGAEGHINVYNTVRHAVRTDTTSTCTLCDYTPNLEDGSTVQGFYTWVTISGTVGLDSAGTVMQFNHPGWINFNDWVYHPEVSDVARLEEVGNGNGSSYTFSEDQYIRSLDYGWKVGATNNADTHTAYWGVNTDHRTGVFMTELTKDNLLEALRERRTFATEDKNFSLSMKANGLWMGSEIANTGQVTFAINGTDPDAELASVVQIITNEGKVALAYTPVTASFSWSPQLVITPGVHYFYVKVTQADGDQIVSSPVWTQGSENIAITDLAIQPTIPTIYNPSLLTVRVTNRIAATRVVTVTLEVDGELVGSVEDLSVAGYGDNFANFSWQPTSVGEVTVTASLAGAPAGDNPDDNQAELHLIVTDEHIPLILIDAGKGNLNATGNEMEMFIDDLSAHQYNVLKNLDELTAADLNPAVVKLLFITAPASTYSSAELTAIGDFVAAGGSLWLSGMADYSSGSEVANRENDILAAIETHTGATINMRLNDDEILDGNDNNGYPWGVVWGSFPSENTTGIGMNVEALASWSVASLRGRTPGTPLTADAEGVQIVVQGDLDTGFTGSYHDANHTSNTDADNGNDAYIYNPTWLDPWDVVPPEAVPVPMAAVTDLGELGGRIMVYGDSNDAFTLYAYTAGDGKQNELFNLEAVMWLMGEPLQKSTIAEARAQAVVNQPDNLDKLVWVEGEITAAYGEFFNVLYVQDATGGITVHAPAGDIDATTYTRGTHVRVIGTIGIYNGDTEIEFFEAEMVQVLDPGTGEVAPLPMTTYEASLEENQGWLSVITGTVTSRVGVDTIFIDDGSGPVRIFLDGYNGDFSDIGLYDLVQVTGLISEDGDGQRIRVRNHFAHPAYADDVIVLRDGNVTYLPIISRIQP